MGRLSARARAWGLVSGGKKGERDARRMKETRPSNKWRESLMRVRRTEKGSSIRARRE